MADGKALAKEEGEAAEADVAGENLVYRAGVGAVKDGQRRAVVNRPAIVVPPIQVRHRDD